MFRGCFQLFLVTFDKQSEELSANVAGGIPFNAKVQHRAGHVEADQPVRQMLQVHGFGQLLQPGQGNGHNIVFLTDKGLFQLNLHTMGGDIAG